VLRLDGRERGRGREREREREKEKGGRREGRIEVGCGSWMEGRDKGRQRERLMSIKAVWRTHKSPDLLNAQINTALMRT
jgi:hypothetical protein